MNSERRRQSARTLVVLSGATLLLGGAVASPAASLFCAGIAGLAALGSLPLGSRRARLAALVLLVLSVGLGLASYPSYQSELERIRERAAAPG